MHPQRYRLIAVLSCLLSCSTLLAGEVSIAVASNFSPAIRDIANDFEKTFSHTANLTFGPTGGLYSMIRSGSSFDAFLAADQRRPQMLEVDGLASGRFTYAIGKLVLWSRTDNQPLDEQTLRQGNYSKLALANPKLSSYGAAAMSVMKHLDVDGDQIQKWLVTDDLVQTYQLIASSKAEMGFIAMSQRLLDNRGSSWEIPQSLYDPIRQDAVLLSAGAENPAAVEFMDYLKGPTVRVILDKYGYATE